MLIPANKTPTVDKVVVLFDADILVYRAGFAAEKRIYTVGSGGPTFPSAKQAKQYADSEGIPRDEISWERNPEPVENALKNLHGMITKTINGLSTRFKCADVSALFILTGCKTTANFREQVSHGYKANRDPNHKPTHYEALRAAISDNYPTIVTEGAETDDYLCPGSKDIAEKYSESNDRVAVVIASIDKDLMAVPGIHYVFTKEELHVVDEDEANLNFFMQTLIGDTADNITGIRGVGPVGARKLLQPHKTNPTKMQALCMQKYKNQGAADWLDWWNQNCHMLYIWREMPDECPWIVDTPAEADSILRG